MNRKRTVFLTGATGNMGWSTLQELLNRKERFNIKILSLPSNANKNRLVPYIKKGVLEVVWGDLLNYNDILRGVSGSDFVLHVGGMVSPKADAFPEETMKVNITAAKNIVAAIKAAPDPDSISVVYIGSVAQTGDRPSPLHWGRCGDPIFPSIHDYYALSKSIAESIFAESGLKRWVSIRQSGMLYPSLLKKANNPIAFHVPFNEVLEWATVEDSGRVLANLCDMELPEQFWRSFYNLSSGSSYRLTNYEFEVLLLKTISVPPPEKIFDIKWFATRNFHGQWYLDSDVLENYLHFRENIECEVYFKRMAKELPWYFSLAKLLPSSLIKLFMKQVAKTKELGTLDWIKRGDIERINAHFGSQDEMNKITSWDDFDFSRPSETPILLDHGYDESKPLSELNIDDIKKAAAFRGGKCLSEKMLAGDIFTPLSWECQFGHKFSATPNTILRGGHWCPECLSEKRWEYDSIAKGNRFFAQVWR